MATARDNVRMTAPAVEVIAGLMGKKPRKTKNNGPVEHRNHLDELDPSLRRYVLTRCQRRGVPVTAVRVISPDEVIIP